MISKIKLFDPFIDKEEESAILKTLKSHNWASGTGKGKVLEFEKKFQNFVGSSKCVALNSGTAALHLGLSLFDIKNKEIILPSLSFVSTAHAILYNGGIPVFVDVDLKTLCLNPDLVKKAISSKTSAILTVHFGGFPSKISELLEICKIKNIPLIEDAAHAVGAKYKNKKIGSHGSAVCFSFHPVKNLAMPTGGAITLNGISTSKRKNILDSLRWCGITSRNGPKYDVKYLGWNYYMNEFSASIGLVQLKKISRITSIRRKIAKQYDTQLAIKNKIPFNPDCSYHLYWILVKNREKFMKNMAESGIETGIHYLPIHKMSFYSKKIKLPVTERAGKEIVTLPIHPNLKQNEIDLIIKSVNNFS